MQFAYVKHLAEALAGEVVTDAVIAVPPYFSQFERDAVADAVEIGGLRTLALVNDGTAIAVNYAMTRTFTTPEIHVFYDAGASSTRATVVRFAPTNDKKEGAGTGITVLGVGFDKSTGGVELDRRLRDILVKDFNSRYNKNLRDNKRGMAKLWKEAGRVKSILSANNDAFATVSRPESGGASGLTFAFRLRAWLGKSTSRARSPAPPLKRRVPISSRSLRSPSSMPLIMPDLASTTSPQ